MLILCIVYGDVTLVWKMSSRVWNKMENLNEVPSPFGHIAIMM